MTKSVLFHAVASLLAVAMLAVIPTASCAKRSPKLKPLPVDYTRIVALGDSITDGFSYPLMVRQALGDAGYEKPYMICAGVASDVSGQMLARLDRDVFPYHPTTVTLLAGTNDGNRGVTPSEYAANVTAIADRCVKEHVKLIILTVPIYGPANVAKEVVTDQYIAWIKQFGKDRGIPVADSNALMKANRDAGRDPIENDNIHPNYLGHQDMTRALLDAMGYPAVPLPAVFTPEVMPGILSQWQIRPTPASQTAPLTDADVAALKPDSTWTMVSVPVATPIGNWWPDQERERGFVSNFAKAVGTGKSYEAVGTVNRGRSATEWMNFGASITAAWLNGVQVYKVGPWTGWHVGHDRVQVKLNRGDNTVVVEGGDPFFVSFTPTTDVGPF